MWQSLRIKYAEALAFSRGDFVRKNANQCNKILRYMTEFGSITPMDAIENFGCMRLGARIFDLKQDGYAIKTEMVKAKNRFGEPVSYARYSLQQPAHS